MSKAPQLQCCAAVTAGADEVGGNYAEDCHVAKPMRDNVENISAVSEGVRVYALDPANAAALWKKERATGRRDLQLTSRPS
ncbi:MAG: hypothetical protein JO260_01090 [Acidobacteria bacterium]|nr:hypothetical protein [Acidobacteriota bacterium]